MPSCFSPNFREVAWAISDPKWRQQEWAWKMIGYPGMRASYLDWVGVRDRAYPLPPVDLAGKGPDGHARESMR